jgi:hypothetical protein
VQYYPTLRLDQAFVTPKMPLDIAVHVSCTRF